MNLAEVSKALELFIEREQSRFQTVSRTATQALELGALVLVAEHYRRVGYVVQPRNLQDGVFRVKLTASGKPWNFSWFGCESGAAAFEIHGNLPVSSATPLDSGTYVVDVGVAPVDCAERLRVATTGKATGVSRSIAGVENEDLLTFVEAKKLIVYPMLLAQFVGIVHEITPQYLQADRGRDAPWPHPFPALVSIGPLRGSSTDIVEGFRRRGFRVNIVPTFDMQIVGMLGDAGVPSPFRGSRADEAESVASGLA